MYSFLGIGAIFTGVLAILTAIVVYFRNRESPINKTFVLVAISVAAWSFGYFFPFTIHSESLSLLSFRILHVGAIFITITNFHFICAVLGIIREKKKSIAFGYIFNLVVLLFVPTKYFIPEVVPKFQFFYWANAGFVYSIWLSVFVAYGFYGIYLLIKNYSKNSGIKKQQLKYILVGDFFSFIGGSTNFFLFYNIDVPPYASSLVTVQIILFAYAVARYHFLDAELGALTAIQKSFAFILSVITGYCTSQILNISSSFASMIFAIAISIVSYISFSSLFDSKIFHKLLKLNPFENFQETIDLFYKKKLFYTSLADLKEAINDTFVHKLGISSANIIFITEKNKYALKSLIQFFIRNKNRKYLILEEFYLTQRETKGIYSHFNELKKMGKICFPLIRSKGNIMGFFILGYKPYQNPYYIEEVEILKSVVNYIDLSLSVLQYNQDLRNEVIKKTAKLRDSNKRLKELDKAKDSFLSIASHELRTPMTAIKGYIDLMLSGEFGHLDARQKHFVGRILHRTDELLNLINDMLDISRLEANRMQFRFADIQICELIKDVVADYGAICDKKRITIKLENPDKLDVKIRTDADKLKLIFNNLISNAYKFTARGGCITIRLQPGPAGFFRCEVQDTGVGIPPDKQKEIFHKFSQVQNKFQSEHKGTGLGLSIVKGILQKLGGKIWVESEEGKGARFIFLIPDKK